MDLTKLPIPKSEVETKTTYVVTSTFTFTEDMFEDTEVRAFYDLLVRQNEEADNQEQEEETIY